jgi:Zn-dependent peptidase ImmA (M78 family)
VKPSERGDFELPIGSLTFTIRFVEKVVGEGDEDLDGFYDPNTDTISIKSSMSEQRQRQTLWHEIMHAILEEGGFQELSEKESLVDLLAHGILSIRKRARWL